MQMLMDLGPVVYVEDFEKHFLAKAAEFYQVRSRCIRLRHKMFSADCPTVTVTGTAVAKLHLAFETQLCCTYPHMQLVTPQICILTV